MATCSIATAATRTGSRRHDQQQRVQKRGHRRAPRAELLAVARSRRPCRRARIHARARARQDVQGATESASCSVALCGDVGLRAVGLHYGTPGAGAAVVRARLRTLIPPPGHGPRTAHRPHGALARLWADGAGDVADRRRALLALPAFWHPRAVWFMAGWDALVLLLVLWDAWRLPRPRQLRVTRTFLDSPQLGTGDTGRTCA